MQSYCVISYFVQYILGQNECAFLKYLLIFFYKQSMHDKYTNPVGLSVFFFLLIFTFVTLHFTQALLIDYGKGLLKAHGWLWMYRLSCLASVVSCATIYGCSKSFFKGMLGVLQLAELRRQCSTLPLHRISNYSKNFSHKTL